MSEHQQTIYDTLRRVAEEEGLHIGAISDSSALIDNLGLHIVESYVKAKEEMIRRQQEEMLELSTPVVKLSKTVGTCSS